MSYTITDKEKRVWEVTTYLRAVVDDQGNMCFQQMHLRVILGQQTGEKKWVNIPVVRLTAPPKVPAS